MATMFSTEICGSKRKNTVLFIQEVCFVLTDISESLWKPPGVFGQMSSRNPVLQLPLSNVTPCCVTSWATDRPIRPMDRHSCVRVLSHQHLLQQSGGWKCAIVCVPWPGSVSACLAWGDVLVKHMLKQLLKRLSLLRHHGTPLTAHLRSVFKISCLFLRPRPWQFEIWDSTDT